MATESSKFHAEEVIGMQDKPMMEGSDDDLALNVGSDDDKEVHGYIHYDYGIWLYLLCYYSVYGDGDEQLDFLTQLEREVLRTSSK